MRPEGRSRMQYGPWFNYVTRRENPRLRVLCLSGAGAGPSEFIPWGQLLPTDIEIWPIQLPGRERRGREPLTTELPTLVDAIQSAIDEHVPDDVPIVFFGHSFGALVTYELARRLGRSGWPIVRLVVSGISAPHLPGRKSALADRTDDELLAWIRELGGTPEELLASDTFRDWLLTDLRASYRIRELYEIADDPIIECPILAYGGASDFETTSETLSAWGQYTSAQFDCHVLPGGHFFLRDHRQQFLAHLVGHALI